MPKRAKCPYGVYDCFPDDLWQACGRCVDDAREAHILERAEQDADFR